MKSQLMTLYLLHHPQRRVAAAKYNGVLLFLMVAGLGHTQILHIVTSGALQLEWPEPPTGSFDSETWKGIVAVGSACLARKREDRPSAEEVQAKLKALLQTAPLVGDL
jgi:hypothetical protein